MERDFPKKVAVDPAEVIAFAEVYDANQQELVGLFDAWSKPKLSITYEELLADEGGVIASICNLLGLNPFEFSSGVSKNLDDSLQSAVSNYDEFATALEGHPYRRFL